MASKRFRDAVGIDPDRIVSAAVDAALGDSQQRGKSKKHHPGRVLVAGAAVATAAAVGQRRLPRLVKVPLRMGVHKLGSKLGDMAHVDDIADAVRDRTDAVRDRLAGQNAEPEDEYYDEEDFDDEEDLDDEDLPEDEDFDDEPRDEAEDLPDDDEGEDDDFDDEDDEGFDDEPEDDGPRDEGDEDDEDEPLDDDELEDDVEPDAEDEVDEDPEAVEDEEDVEPEDEEDVEPEEDDEEIAARSLDLGLPNGSGGRRARHRVPDLFEALRTPHRRAPVMRRESLRVDPATRPPKPDESGRSSHRRDRRSKNTKSAAARA